MKLSSPESGAAVRFAVFGYRRALAWVAVTSVLGGAAEAVFLIAVTRAAFAITAGADRIGVVGGWYVSTGQALGIALLLVVLRVGLAVYASWRSARVTTGAVARVRRRLAGAFLAASWEAQQTQRAGSLQELLSSHSNQVSGLVMSVGNLVVATANLVALVGIAIAVDPAGAVVLVVTVSVLALLLRPVRAGVRRRSQVSIDANMALATSVNEVSDLGLELHVFHVQEGVHGRIENLIENARVRAQRLLFASSATGPIYIGLAYLALLGALAIVALSADASLTSLGAAMLVMLRSLSYGQGLQTAYTGIASNAPAVEALRGHIDHLEGARRVDDGEPVGSLGPLVAVGVRFAYSPGQDVLRDISFTIAPNEVVGVVGPSGSGKSTLVQLLLGLRDPNEGSILAGGRDLRSFDKRELARRLTFVPQSAHLVAGSVAENIRFFREGVSQEQIEHAARLAHLHDDVMGFPEGYQREVGERGGQLSGGQQQRLCIARALVEQPDVLIMDEPTSALDVRSEHLVRTTLQELRERMTVVVIAHRLSTLDICDRIMVIQDGELKGFDSPRVLEQSSSFYREALALSGMR